jgi:hypothetical protein
MDFFDFEKMDVYIAPLDFIVIADEVVAAPPVGGIPGPISCNAGNFDPGRPR